MLTVLSTSDNNSDSQDEEQVAMWMRLNYKGVFPRGKSNAHK
jgi:hypothetical protein